MKAYQYDEDGYYQCEVECQSCPMSGGHLLPRNAVMEEPPKCEDGHKLRWVDNGWVSEKIPEPVKEPEVVEIIDEQPVQMLAEEEHSEEKLSKSALKKLKKRGQ